MKSLLCIFGLHDWKYENDEAYQGSGMCPDCQNEYGRIRTCKDKDCGKKQIQYHLGYSCEWMDLTK